VAALFNGALGLGLAAADLQKLTARTEGWAAGLYLAALSLRERPDRSAFIAEFAGDNRHIVAYLGGEVLQALAADTRAFLLQTAILGQCSPALCEAVTGEAGAAERLAALEQSNQFVIPLDERGEWYRYHHLFRELLQLELRRTEPALVPLLHRRAAVWYRGAGDVSAAMHHALAAQDFTLAGDLFLEYALPELWAGHLATLASWLDALPEATIAARPALAVATAWIEALSGRGPAEMERRLSGAVAGPDVGQLLLGEPSLEAAVALTRATYPVNDVGEAVAAGETAVAAVYDADTTAYLLSRAALGRALYLAGRAADAQVLLEEALDAPLASRQVVGASRAFGTLALVCLELGEEARASELARHAVQLCEDLGYASHSSVWLNYLALGTVLVREGRLEQAEAVLAQRVEPQLEWLRAWPLFYAQALLGLAQARIARGHMRAAGALLGEARTVIEGCADPGLLASLLTATEQRLQRLTPRKIGLGEELTESELRILRLLASDLSQREIAQELYLSVNTVKSHTRSIYAKLDAGTREEAVSSARSLALIA
jgi:LuxR family maltose regulon positive regulatory protein